MSQARQLQELEGKIRKEKDKTLKYIYLHRLADASREEGNLAYALKLYREARIIARNMNDSKRECETLVDLGLTADKFGRISDAIRFYKDALAIAESIGDVREQSHIHGELGVLYAREGKVTLAAKHFTRANNKARRAKWRTVRITEEVPPKAVTTLNKRTRRRVAQPSEPHPLAGLNTEINQMNRTRLAERGIIFVISVLCLAVFIILGKDIFSLSPAYLLVAAAVVILLGMLYYNAYRSK